MWNTRSAARREQLPVELGARPALRVPSGTAGADDAVGVLERVRALREVERAAAAALLQEACTWADLHPALEDATVLRCAQTDQLLTADGVPPVDHRCVAELAAVLAVSTATGQRLLVEALELRHRLPRLWRLVGDGGVEPWRARSVARATLPLGRAAAGFVDAQVAVLAGRVGPVQLERLVAAAVVRFDPEEAARQERQQAEQRRVRVLHPRTRGALSWVDGTLDLPDALDLDAALSAGARALAEGGSTDSLDVRRARALGQLARGELGLPLAHADPSGSAHRLGRDAAGRPGVSGSTAHPAGAATVALGAEAAPRPARPGGGAADGVAPRPVPPERVVLYVHLAADALNEAGSGPRDATGGLGGRRSADPVATVGNTGTVVTADQVRRWCGRPDLRVTVRPVVDLGREITVEGYAVPERLRERVCLRDQTCVFPWCSRPAHPRPLRTRSIRGESLPTDARDIDHGVPYGVGGTTSSSNLAPLCRRHHQNKTHGGWRYLTLRPGGYLWTSPHGHQFLRDGTGTRAVLDRWHSPGSGRPDTASSTRCRPGRSPGPPERRPGPPGTGGRSTAVPIGTRSSGGPAPPEDDEPAPF